MPEGFVEQMGERLARLTNRRKFLRRAIATVFGLVTAGMAEFTFTPSAHAIAHCTNVTSETSCSPPLGKNCTTINSSYCSGALCSGGCTINKLFWPNTGCWCTRPYCVGSLRVYYQCCDCSCPGGQLCGCSHAVKVAGVCRK
jgi:hypothetical protein